MARKPPSHKITLDSLYILNWATHGCIALEGISDKGAVLFGSNGSGKSTTLDALLTLVLGEHTGKSYNQAASAQQTSRDRDFLSYVLGKQKGVKAAEGKRIGREGTRFTTHLCAIFRDSLSRNYTVFGLACDYDPCKNPSSRLNDTWYCYDTYHSPQPLALEDYLDDPSAAAPHAITSKELFGKLADAADSQQIKSFHTFQTAREYREQFCNRMNITDRTAFYDTTRRLVAISPDSDVNELLYGFLVGQETNEATDDALEKQHNWQSSKLLAETAQQNLARLAVANECWDKYRAAVMESEVVRRVDNRVTIRKTEKEIARLKTAIAATEARAKKNATEKAEVEQKQNLLDEELEGIVNQLNDNKEHLELTNNRRKRAELKAEAAGLDEKISCGYQVLAATCAFTRAILETGPCAAVAEAAKGVLSAAGPVEDTGEDAIGELRANFDGFSAACTSLSHAAGSQRDEFAALRAQTRKEMERIASDLKTLEAQKAVVVGDANTRELIEYIRREAGAEVIMFCDTLDIAEGENAWDVAVERWLGARRFNLVCRDADFMRVAAAMRRFPKKRHASLLSPRRLLRGVKTPQIEESLLEKVTVKDGWFHDLAAGYAAMTMAQVRVYDGDTNLFKACKEDRIDNAVTQDGVTYRAAAITDIPADFSSTLVIGADARERARAARITALRAEQSGLAKTLAETAAQIDRYRALLQNLPNTDEEHKNLAQVQLDTAIEAWERRDIVEDKLSAIDNIIACTEDGEYQALVAREQEIKRKLEVLGKDRDEIVREEGRIETDLARDREALGKGRKQLENQNNQSQSANPAYAITEAENSEIERRVENHMSGTKKDANEYIQKNRESAAEKAGETKNKLEQARRECVVGMAECAAHLTDTDNEFWRMQYEELEQTGAPEAQAAFEAAGEKVREGFISSTVGRMNQALDAIKRRVRRYNAILRQNGINGEHYELVCTPTTDKTFSRYYKLISDRELSQGGEGLFGPIYISKYGPELDSLFELLSESELGENEKVRTQAKKHLEQFTKLHNYLDFDLKLYKSDGTTQSFVEGAGSLSGGEQAFAFYLILLCSLAEATGLSMTPAAGPCLAVAPIDEAFNKTDANRIDVIYDLMGDLGLQPIIATPDNADIELLMQKSDCCAYRHAMVDGHVRIASFKPNVPHPAPLEEA